MLDLIDQLAVRANAYGIYAGRRAGWPYINVNNPDCPDWVRKRYVSLRRPADKMAWTIVAWLVLMTLLPYVLPWRLL
jgi:hypothetical protein